MDKTALRKEIRDKKRAMTPEQIEKASQCLAQQFFATSYYQQAKTLYGYLPYNQEVRTEPILLQALKDGKKVAVPKVYVLCVCRTVFSFGNTTSASQKISFYSFS